MCIRKATFTDLGYIRKLPVQLTARPVTKILPKHFRVLAQESAVRLLVFQGTHAPSAFLALRFMPAENSAVRFLLILHLGLDRHALLSGAAAELEEQGVAIAREQQCLGLLVNACGLTPAALRFYQERGYSMQGEALLKTLC